MSVWGKCSPQILKVTKTTNFEIVMIFSNLFVFSEDYNSQKNNADLPVIIIPPPAPLAATSHLAFVLDLPSRAHFDGGVLQSDGLQNNLAATLFCSLKKHGTKAEMRILTGFKKKKNTVQQEKACCSTFSSSSTSSGWTRPWTDSPFTWVMRSPVRRPA